MKSLLSTLFSLIFPALIIHIGVSAQQGSDEIYKDIRKLGVLANVLYVAAHPDDENTRLISYFSNHLAVNTTYLSITRGDGGQNLIGSEIREMLGVIRTHELLGAREIDGGNQVFTRANDFGYSKSPSETFTIWNRDEVLSDVVWAIRQIKPDIIINRFNSDITRPNHGHHTASAILAIEAFDLASKSSAYPEQLKFVETWQPQRLFWNTSVFFYGSREAFDKVDKSRMIAVDIGAYDPVTGESNSEISGRSRSMHKSQGFGSAETRGENLDYMELIKDVGNLIPKDAFEGIDITWNRVPGGGHIGKMVKDLEASFDFKAPSKSVTQLIAIHDAIHALPDSYWKKIKLAECEKLIKDCLGLFIEVRTNKFKVSPESTLPVTLEVINRAPVEVVILSMKAGEQDTTFTFATPLIYNKGFIKEIKIVTPDHLNTPYWLISTPTEGMYVVPDQSLRGKPADPPSIMADIVVEVGESVFSFQTPVIYKTVDPAEGEITRPLSIVPPVSVHADADVLVFNKGQERTIQFTLTASQDSVQGELLLHAEGDGWKITPNTIPWKLNKSNESINVICTITPPNTTSKATLRPDIKIGNNIYHHKITTLDYDHLPYMSVVRDATVELQSLDIKITPRPIGYIEGAGDDVPASLGQIGFNLQVIDPQTITSETLEKYQVVILGIRAFNTVESLATKNKVLFDWVKSGGTLIVQYNVSRGLITEEISPYPITLSRDRVTEENSPVHLLDPEHPALQFPNKINENDFKGWVQERGLYFPNAWDEAFTPLLEMSDTGENPTKGALLVAPYGDGFYVYTGLSFFRHLPAGIPGSYRLLSNLIALGHKNNKS